MKHKKLDHERFDRLESTVHSQHEKLDRLESLVYRLIHRDRIGLDSVQRWGPQRNNTFGTDDSRSETPILTGNTTPLPIPEVYDFGSFRKPEFTTT